MVVQPLGTLELLRHRGVSSSVSIGLTAEMMSESGAVIVMYALRDEVHQENNELQCNGIW